MKPRTDTRTDSRRRAPIRTSELKVIDYKNIELLKKFTDSYGRISSKRRTGISANQQREISLAIKRARFLGLLPFVAR